MMAVVIWWLYSSRFVADLRQPIDRPAIYRLYKTLINRLIKLGMIALHAKKHHASGH
jgi:hypothetical protein